MFALLCVFACFVIDDSLLFCLLFVLLCLHVYSLLRACVCCGSPFVLLFACFCFVVVCWMYQFCFVSWFVVVVCFVVRIFFVFVVVALELFVSCLRVTCGLFCCAASVIVVY